MVVVVVPLAVVAAQDPETVPAPAPTTTPSVPTPTTTPTTPAPSGGPPQIAYAEGDRIHEPGGRVFQLPRDLGVSGFVAYRGGYLVADARYFEGSVGLTRYDAGGRAVASWTSAGRPVSSADGLVTTWTSFAPPESGTTAPTLVHVASSTGDGPEVTQELDLIQPSVVGMVGVDVVIEGGFGAGGVWATDLVSAPRRIEVLDRATDVSDAQGLIAGSVDQDAIGRVVDAATGEVLWERQGVTVSAFSPDGRYAVATASQGGRREIVEARTGEVLAEVKASGEEHFPTLLELTWEDDGHLLGDLAFNCCAHLGRVDLDGNITPARPRGEIGGTGFVFAATS
ncbi:hypothetical protein NSZ01_36760 [Nocardioides szechwanensis]|nr:hypothetical protein NSZ01_36760 [Nocardioides szechwanensis]